MLLATPFLTADAGEAFSLQVGMQDISIAGPPSKCTGGPHISGHLIPFCSTCIISSKTHAVLCSADFPIRVREKQWSYFRVIAVLHSGSTGIWPGSTERLYCPRTLRGVLHDALARIFHMTNIADYLTPRGRGR